MIPGDLETQTGGYVFARRIIEGLRLSGWEIEVHTLGPGFPNPSLSALQHARSRLAGLNDDRVVVIDGLALGCMPDVVKPEAERLRLIALLHHPLAMETGLDLETARAFRESERAALAFVRGVIVTSAWTQRVLAGYGVAKDRIRVVEPGADTPPRRRTRMPEMPRDSDRAALNLLCVATLTPRKGHAILFDALGSLRDRRWHLRCAGSLARDPDTVRTLRLQIERLGLTDRIELLGEVDADVLERCYDDCDIFVLASYMEGYGMVLAEALAHGIPVVSTRAGAIPETVNPDASLLVKSGDVGALAHALAMIMDDAGIRERLAANALAGSSQLPRWSDSCSKFGAAVEDLAVRAR